MNSSNISAKTALYGVVGDPVSHSLSPLIHNLWIQEAQVDARYLAFHLKSDSVVEDLRSLGRAGVSGLNITLPHKAAAFAAASNISDVGRALGVANTLILDDNGAWRADNTDVAGFRVALSRLSQGRATSSGESGLTDKFQRAVLIGAGGAGRAAAYALGFDDSLQLTIVNRTPERAVELVDSLQIEADIVEFRALEAAIKSADLVVNATSAGHSDGTALQWPEARPGQCAFDLSYGAAADDALRAARVAGWITEDGLAMLVGQAAESFTQWFGVEPDLDQALAACRSAVGGGA
ncbi:MAG: shikimate dehydrogenase [Pseudomonadota bacterium]